MGKLTTTVNSPTDHIKHYAMELGFSKFGIARAEMMVAEQKQLLEWLSHGYQASMQWMERDVEKRINPSIVLPNAYSVISVALNYYTPGNHSSDPKTAKISRYAWGDDYHEVMTEKLQLLLKFIESQVPGANGKLYVDTGPVMDKAWAVRAGIGWMGKHSNVITKEMGSWIFLGEILLDTELEYDEPIMDHCGICTACLDACPTGAIVQPYVVDSNRCISYLTIEHRGDISQGAANKFQNWVYGCDICQDVCPWNRFQKETSEPAFSPRKENINPPLAELAELSPEEFSRRFRKNPIKRTKVNGLVRNAKAVLESQQTSR